MPAERHVAVLGLGRFGQAVARELARIGHSVLAVDMDEKTVQAIAPAVTHAVQADVTNEAALRELGIGEFDTVIIGLSGDIESSILAAVIARRLGARRVIAKAGGRLHGSILEQLGVDRVVYPERETGIRIARSFAAPAVSDYLDAAPGYGIAKVPIPEGLAGRPLSDLDLRRIRVNAIALFRDGSVTLNPMTSEVLRTGDELIVAGADEDLERVLPQVAP